MKADKSRAHYNEVRFMDENSNQTEAKFSYRNVGWSLGNACPLKCKQCYSRCARDPGANLTKELVDRIINQLTRIGVQTINLGGNEPIYTNGLDPRESLLPYIVDSVVSRGIKIGITTAGPTLIQLEQYYPEYLSKINDVDISLDSPIESEHDENRGQPGIYKMALRAVEISKKYQIPRSIIMCGMNWNFTPDRILSFIKLAKSHDANFRVNPIKPVEPYQMDLILSPAQFYEGLALILENADPVDLSDPAWATSVSLSHEIVSGCPCGTSSFRIHSITPEGMIPVSPCVYLHDYKFGDLVTMEIEDVINSVPFKVFRRRKNNPESVSGCQGCEFVKVCGGGCASRAYLHNLHSEGDEKRSLFYKDPYCYKDNLDKIVKKIPTVAGLLDSDHALVHQGYLCTGIFTPKKDA